MQIDGPVPDRSALKDQSVVAHQPGNALLMIRYTPPEHPDKSLLTSAAGWADGSGVTFDAPLGTTSVWVKVDGYQSTELPWTGEGCDASAPPTAPEAAVVTGTVDPAFGEPVVMGCRPQGYPRHVISAVPVDASGRFRKEVPPGPCRLRAWRQDGTLNIYSPWVDVSPALGEVTHVDLALPEDPQGILGIWTEVAPGGMVVERVLTGSPAYEAGLRVGDLITAIDGVPTADMHHDEWSHHASGAIGDPAVLSVETSWGSERIEVRRASPDGSWLEEP